MTPAAASTRKKPMSNPTDAEVDAQSILATWPLDQRRAPFSLTQAQIVARAHLPHIRTYTVDDLAQAIAQYETTPKDAAPPECDCEGPPHTDDCLQFICRNAWARVFSDDAFVKDSAEILEIDRAFWAAQPPEPCDPIDEEQELDQGKSR